MKTVWKIIGAIFGLLLVAVLIVAFWQKDNISAFITAMRYTPEQLKEQISENDKALKKELVGLLGSKNIRDYTEEEKALIERGEASEKEILAKIIAEQGGWITPASASGDGQIEAGGSSSQTQDSGSEPTKSADTIISGYVAQLYAMEGRYLASIDGVLDRAYAEYVSTAKHNQDTAAMTAVGAKYITEIYSLESSCDAEVNTLLDSLKAELTAIGADTSIIGTIRSAYNNEKQLKRSYYMSKYMQ